MPSPFSCSPVIREWSWKKTQIEKKNCSIHLLMVEIGSKKMVYVNLNKLISLMGRKEGKKCFPSFSGL